MLIKHKHLSTILDALRPIIYTPE